MLPKPSSLNTNELPYLATETPPQKNSPYTHAVLASPQGGSVALLSCVETLLLQASLSTYNMSYCVLWWWGSET